MILQRNELNKQNICIIINKPFSNKFIQYLRVKMKNYYLPLQLLRVAILFSGEFIPQPFWIHIVAAFYLYIFFCLKGSFKMIYYTNDKHIKLKHLGHPNDESVERRGFLILIKWRGSWPINYPDSYSILSGTVLKLIIIFIRLVQSA